MTSITEHQLFVSSCYSTYLDLPINEQLTGIVTSLKESYISGVYYIKVPSNSGNIVFSRAESETERMYFQTKEIMDKSLSVNDPRVNTEHWFTPKEGMLLLFPGHLKHTVEQNLSEEIDSTRISMSFNFNP